MAWRTWAIRALLVSAIALPASAGRGPTARPGTPPGMSTARRGATPFRYSMNPFARRKPQPPQPQRQTTTQKKTSPTTSGLLAPKR